MAYDSYNKLMSILYQKCFKNPQCDQEILHLLHHFYSHLIVPYMNLAEMVDSERFQATGKVFFSKIGHVI